jgi:hypothetical protein
MTRAFVPPGGKPPGKPPRPMATNLNEAGITPGLFLRNANELMPAAAPYLDNHHTTE